jgi:hypothetical protein
LQCIGADEQNWRVNIRQFVSERFGHLADVVGHLAWPAVVLVLFLVFRKQISEQVRRLSRFEGPTFVLQFETQVEPSVEKALSAEAARPVRVTEESNESLELVRERERSDIEGRFRPVALAAGENPSYAVVAAWSALEEVAIRAAQQAAPELFTGQGLPRFNTALDAISRRDLLTPASQDALRELRALRNKTAHGTLKPDQGSATAYVETARKLAWAIWVGAVLRESGLYL